MAFHFVLTRLRVPRDSEVYINKTVEILVSSSRNTCSVWLLIAVLQKSFTMTQLEVQLDILSWEDMPVHISPVTILECNSLDFVSIVLMQSPTSFLNSKPWLSSLQFHQLFSRKSINFDPTDVAALGFAESLSSTSYCEVERALHPLWRSKSF